MVMNKKTFQTFASGLLLVLVSFLSACASVPKGVEPVTGIDAKRYTGKWYEVARLENTFEKGLTQVTADYKLRDDGDIDVINRGYDAAKQQWKEAKGLAKFVQTPDVGRLKVSFFGPFYGGYNIISLDKAGYQYSMVAGNDRSYLWILSRTPSLPTETLNTLIAAAKRLDFPVDQLLMVEQKQ